MFFIIKILIMTLYTELFLVENCVYSNWVAFKGKLPVLFLDSNKYTASSYRLISL